MKRLFLAGLLETVNLVPNPFERVITLSSVQGLQERFNAVTAETMDVELIALAREIHGHAVNFECSHMVCVCPQNRLLEMYIAMCAYGLPAFHVGKTNWGPIGTNGPEMVVTDPNMLVIEPWLISAAYTRRLKDIFTGMSEEEYTFNNLQTIDF